MLRMPNNDFSLLIKAWNNSSSKCFIVGSPAYGKFKFITEYGAEGAIYKILQGELAGNGVLDFAVLVRNSEQAPVTAIKKLSNIDVSLAGMYRHLQRQQRTSSESKLTVEQIVGFAEICNSREVLHSHDGTDNNKRGYSSETDFPGQRRSKRSNARKENTL